ncbi:imelysin family protein [Magnetospirillum gryphiswaldense]|uniref:Lipoprotein n=1 Tax=Magnetospirillum gryphiswaldense TaxID=55518 RepID=A4U0U3_9PROT|nr:imelysin family protein [Magnetospirillum gryphiswaldense]AVM74274.1 Imelysin [Magnetospirillum gryphiswaldense MSR-1]AVM78177.1 Imelysin [Magnetospirillum gryphiswaldense]CAM76500.1 lipoprotein [Magnetospirillum gryphiswaldense MSR-1]
MKRFVMVAASAAVLLGTGQAGAAGVDKKAVLTTYADIAHAKYEDSLIAAKQLKVAIDALVAAPSAETLATAKAAWIAARVPYQQSEAFRFGNTAVDEWEGKVNAWPLDEGLIDYVNADTYGTESGENPLYTANIIAHPKLKVGGKNVNASKIDKKLLAKMHEAGGVEANVTTGYHAIEFMLWGQDTNGTGPGAGNRPASDFDTKSCTGGNCDRRAAYLVTATDLLVDDLKTMVDGWGAKGKIRAKLLKGKADAGIATIVTGLGSLSYGELAGERMKLGLMLHDPEEEHDCFSDNTHNSHFYDAKGIQNIYLGKYTRTDGTEVKGPALADLVAAKDATLDGDMKAKLDATMTAMGVLVKTAEGGEAYDQMIGAGNSAGNAKVQAAIDALVAQTRSLEKAVAVLALGEVKFEGSDSLDNPSAIGK